MCLYIETPKNVTFPFETNGNSAITEMYRVPDKFLKQGVADASLEPKGVSCKMQKFFHSQVFTQVRFYKLQI